MDKHCDYHKVMYDAERGCGGCKDMEISQLRRQLFDANQAVRRAEKERDEALKGWERMRQESGAVVAAALDIAAKYANEASGG